MCILVIQRILPTTDRPLSFPEPGGYINVLKIYGATLETWKEEVVHN